MKKRLSRQERRKEWKTTWNTVTYAGETRSERRRRFHEAWDGYRVRGY